MTRSIIHGIAARAILLLLYTQGTIAQTSPLWRFWNVNDGLTESNSNWLVTDPRGEAWIKHGEVDFMSRLDGYTVAQVPDSHVNSRLSTAGDGELWIYRDGELRRYIGSRWHPYRVPGLSAAEAGHSNIFCALGNGRVLILIPDRLLEFDAEAGAVRTVKSAASTRLRRFIRMNQGRDGRIWIGGSNGLASLSGRVPDHSFEWREYPAPAELTEINEPREGESGEVFVSARRAGKNVIARFDGKAWAVIYASRDKESRAAPNALGPHMQAWRGADHDLWVEDHNTILRLSNGQKERADRQEALAGTILSVNPGDGGAFWVPTTQGIARYAPPLWRTPPPLRNQEAESVVSAITEDRNGTVWFTDSHALLGFDGTSWKSYDLPLSMAIYTPLTDTLRALPDGTLALASGASSLLVFHPDTAHFEKVRHPEGRTIRLLGDRREGGLFVQTVEPSETPLLSPDFRIEIFDGHAFHPYLDPGKTSGIPDLRSIYETSGGDLWLGGLNALAVYRNGIYRLLGPADNYRGGAAYSILEHSPGRLWVGGRNELQEFDGKRWTKLTSGMDRIRTLMQGRDGTLWVASGTGIHRFRDGSWITNIADDGLPSSVGYRVFEDSRGRIWAGTARGLSLFHPDADVDPPHTTIREDANSHTATPDGLVRLVFAGMDKWKFTPAERLLFSYRLDSGPWTPFASGNAASYRSLPTGKHHFEVRAMDRNGNIDHRPASFDFNVMLPWYRNPDFRHLALLFAGCFGVLLAAHYLHRGRLIQQLQRARKAEQGRKEILELIAKRANLRSILETVACQVEASEPGCGAAVMLANGSSIEMEASVGLPHDFYSHFSRCEPCERNAVKRGTQPQFLPAGFRSYCYMPVPGGTGQLLGSLEVYYRHQSSITDLQLVFLDGLARLTATAIENIRLNEALAYQARYDSLTGLPNRVHFERRLEESIEKAHAGGRKIALLYLDLDRFKQINDSLGHRAGDELLREAGSRLSGCVGNRGFVGRIGGDEFNLLLEPVERVEEAEEMAVRILQCLERPISISAGTLVVSGTIGISVYPADGEDANTLQKNADSAMYKAKDCGKNRYELFSARSCGRDTPLSALREPARFVDREEMVRR